MEAEKPEEQALKRSRISLGALAELENALRDYKEAVREAECARDGIEEQTVRSYIRGPEKFVAWLKYEFAPGPPLKGPIPPRSIERPPVGRSRISLSALKKQRLRSVNISAKSWMQNSASGKPTNSSTRPTTS